MLRLLNRLTGGILVPDEIGKLPPPSEAAGATPVYRGFVPGLTALRALGVTIVVLDHAWPGDSSTLEMGWILMDCFFVMSGFFIGGILLDSRSRSDYFLSFYVRRALRILPLYYLVITVLTLVIVLARTPDYAEMLHTWGSPLWFFVYLGNIPTALTGEWPSGGHWAFTPLWSLQIEEQFYLLFPLLVRRLPLATLAKVLLGLIVLSPAVRVAIYVLNPSNELAQYVLLPCRMEGLALGALLAMRFRSGPWTIPRTRLTILTAAWVTVLLVATAWAGFQHDTAFNRTAGYLLSSITSAYVALWLLVFRDSRATAWLRLPPIQHVGKISYGVYVLHWPLMYALATLYARFKADWLETSFIHTGLVYFGTIALASISWRFLEGPLLKVRGRWLAARAAAG